MTERRSYTDEFKREAVRLAKANGCTRTGHELGIDRGLIRKWRNKLEGQPERPFPGHGNARDQELAQLHRKLRRLEEENAVLKKAVGIFSERPR